MPDFDVTLNDNGTVVSLTGMARRAAYLLPAHQSGGELMYASTMENFETETDPYGRPWQRNSPFVLAEKRRLGRIMKVLQSTGVMKARTSYRIVGGGFVIGIYDRKIRRHMEGAGVPQRIPLGVGPQDLIDLRENYRSYILDGDRNA